MINLYPEVKNVLLAGDWHGNTSWACAVVDKSREILDTPNPLIIQLGDFGIWHGAGGGQYLDLLTEALIESNADLLFVDGNHENHKLLKNIVRRNLNTDGTVQVTERIRYLPRGYRFSLGNPEWNRSFLALGGAVSVDKACRTEGTSWWADEVLSPEDIDLAISGGHAWAMLTHDAPHVLYFPFPPPPDFWDPEDLVKSELHRQVMTRVFEAVRPEVFIHGHYHFRINHAIGSTRVTSLGTDGEQGNVAVLDLGNGVVR